MLSSILLVAKHFIGHNKILLTQSDFYFRGYLCFFLIHYDNTPMLHYTIMDFSAGVHDVICTRKINIDRGGSRGQYYFFLVHITSCTPAEKAINVLLYNQPV